MIHEVTTEGPSVAEAIDAALDELGVQQDAVEYEVLAEPGHGLFGGGSKIARVRVWLKSDEVPPTPPAAEADSRNEDDLEQDWEETEELPQELRTAPADLTDAQLDAIADAGVATINSIVGHLGIEASIEEYEGDEGEIILDIVGDDLGILIGRHGRTLDALQILVSAITNRTLEQRYPVVVDISGYRHRRRLKLEEIARRAADRVARQHQAVELRPMTSFERRVIHITLRDDRRVRTESEGVEPRRMVVIHPK